MHKLLTGIVSSFILTGSSVAITATEMVTIDLPINLSASEPYKLWDIPYPVSKTELDCLAHNVYFEARGEGPDGQFAVADVVMYRVNHPGYPNTICGVVKQANYHIWDITRTSPIKFECSFSWYCNRLSDVPTNKQSLREAIYVATTVLNDPNYIPVVEHALFYHADYVQPYWAEFEQPVAYIGKHLFY
jgi:spore germination cell wall hydrolase CwlJ-like protein